MKKLIALLCLVSVGWLVAQANPITAITISLPANPDAVTITPIISNQSPEENISQFVITATAELKGGHPDPVLAATRILSTIKQQGKVVFGSYTPANAPLANFTGGTKTWKGAEAVALLGKGAPLPKGDYELSVQFFGSVGGKVVSQSDEKIKPFTIRGNDQQSYQLPQPVSPAGQFKLTETEALNPITLRWTPVVPKPQAPVTYRLSIWQLKQGQTGPQAIKANSPILTKDVENLTSFTAKTLLPGPAKAPSLYEFVWTVQAVTRDGTLLAGAKAAVGTGMMIPAASK